MNKLKVLHITSSLGPGGKERQLVETVKYLVDEPIILSLISLKTNQHYTQEVKSYLSNYVEIRRRKLLFISFLALWFEIRKIKPDIIHCWDTYSMLFSYIPAKFYRIKIIDGSIRDAGVDQGWEYYYKKYFLQRADTIIANSYAGLKVYNVRGYVIYNSIDTRRFHKKSMFNESLNIIMVGNFNGYKDHKTFIDASAVLIKDNIIDTAVLLGDGPEKEKFITYVKSNYPGEFHRIKFLGTVKNVEETLSNFNVGVLCSTKKFSEGLSNSILEYMAAGLLSIGTNVGGTSEVIIDGQNGFLVEPGDANKIIQIIRSLRAHEISDEIIIKNAKETIQNKFSPVNNICKLIEIYKGLVN